MFSHAQNLFPEFVLHFLKVLNITIRQFNFRLWPITFKTQQRTHHNNIKSNSITFCNLTTWFYLKLKLILEIKICYSICDVASSTTGLHHPFPNGLSYPSLGKRVRSVVLARGKRGVRESIWERVEHPAINKKQERGTALPEIARVGHDDPASSPPSCPGKSMKSSGTVRYVAKLVPNFNFQYEI